MLAWSTDKTRPLARSSCCAAPCRRPVPPPRPAMPRRQQQHRAAGLQWAGRAGHQNRSQQVPLKGEALLGGCYRLNRSGMRSSLHGI